MTTTYTEQDLEGRTARCYCGSTAPSSRNLAFFEFRGEGSREASETCGVCGFHEIAHDPTAEHMARIEGGATRYENLMKRVGGIHDFTPKGGVDTDRFYCGCRGWD